MVEVFSEIAQNITIVKNGDGLFCVPSYQINSIGNWNIADGYQVYATAPCILSVTGNQVIPENTPLFLSPNWNLISYLRTSPMEVETALANISQNIVLVKDNSGGLYIPQYNINTLGELIPGRAYWIYLNQPVILTYPGNE